MSSGSQASAPAGASSPLAMSEVAEVARAARSRATDGRTGGAGDRLRRFLTRTEPPRVAIGAASGCLATFAMTAAMLGMQRALPRSEQYPLPPRRITGILARRVGIRRKVNRRELNVATALAHFSYGTAAGALYGPLGIALPVPGVASGVGYGLLVWAGSYLGLLPALGILRPATEHPAGRNVLMIAAHVVWGASLGWLAERIATPAGRR